MIDVSKSALSYSDDAVIKHIGLHNNIVDRFSSNSDSCKKMSIILVAMSIFLTIRYKDPAFGVLSLFIISFFYFLDVYYFSISIRFRASLNTTTIKIINGNFTQYDLFKFIPEHSVSFSKIISSVAIWPIYLGQMVLVLSSFYLLTSGSSF